MIGGGLPTGGTRTAGNAADGEAGHVERTRPRSLWRNTEATLVYRAMTRHLRKHVARGTEQYALDFMLRPNPLVMARTMQQSQ